MWGKILFQWNSKRTTDCAVELLHIKLFSFSETLELVSLLITHLYCSISTFHHISEQCTSINSNIIVFVLLHMTYWNSSFPSWPRVSSFTLTIKKKYSDRSGIPIYISITFIQHKMTDQEKKTLLLCCSLFIHFSYEMHASIRSFWSCFLEKYLIIFLKRSLGMWMPSSFQAYSGDIWVVSA